MKAICLYISLSLSLATLQSNCQNIFDCVPLVTLLPYKMSTKSSKSSIISVASQKEKPAVAGRVVFWKGKKKN